MELRIYLAVLWRRKWIVVITALVAVIVAAIGTFMITPTYATSTTLRVATTSGSTVNFGDTVYSEKLMRTYTKMATSNTILGMVTESFNLDQPPNIGAEIIAATELLEISVEHEDPILAAAIADFVGEILIDQSKRVRDFRNNPAYIVGPATIPKDPTTPGLKLMIPIGLLVGLAGGIGLAFLFENLDTTLYTTEQIELATELSALGKIPRAGRNQKHEMFMNGSSPQGEAFRRLRTNIFSYDRESPIKTLLITSAEPGEGKSTITTNLSYAMVQSGRKVIVVDSDLRRPTIHKMFNLPNEVGLSSVLQQKTALRESVQASIVPGIHVLTSGPVPSNPAELLETSQMTTLIEQLEQQFDMVLLDTPALVPVVDAAIIAPMVDGIVLVVSHAQVRKEAVHAAYQQLVDVRAKPLGIIVNRVNQERKYDYYVEGN